LITTPVAFFIFNRPDLTEIVFQAIAQARPQKLLIIADGPRTAEEAEKCQQTRAIVEKVDWDCQVIKNFSDRNMGCRARMSSGVKWVFSQTDEAIFLEDDCLPNASFFPFCQTLLDYYREDKRVMHINGGNFLFDRIHIPDSYYFSRYNFVGYGWASWKRAWKYYDADLTSWDECNKQRIFESVFEDPYERNYWQQIFSQTVSGELKEIWDFQWFYSCWTQGGLAITPRVNLVSNLGFRPDATHTNTAYERSYLADIPRRELNDIAHPKFVLRNREADTHTFEIYFGRQNLDQKKRSFLMEKAWYYWTALKWKLNRFRQNEL
jgi:hypothetical protein